MSEADIRRNYLFEALHGMLLNSKVGMFSTSVKGKVATTTISFSNAGGNALPKALHDRLRSDVNETLKTFHAINLSCPVVERSMHSPPGGDGWYKQLMTITTTEAYKEPEPPTPPHEEDTVMVESEKKVEAA